MMERLLLARRQVGAGAVRDLGGHADRFAQRRMRVDRLADVHRVRAHLDGQRDLADHVAGVRADDAAAEDLAVAVGLGGIVEQQLREAFVAAVGDRPARGRPREQALLNLDALRLGLVLGQTHPRHFRIGVGHARDHAGVERAGALTGGRTDTVRKSTDPSGLGQIFGPHPPTEFVALQVDSSHAGYTLEARQLLA